MSTSPNGNAPVDASKKFPFYPPEYWMITEEWTQTIQESKVDPSSQGRTMIKKMVLTRAICTHPLAHHVAGLAAGIQNYKITDSIPITKKLYDWWVNVTQPAAAQVSKIVDSIEAEEEGRRKSE